MGVAAFVAGDWGTTNLRLFLCDAQGVALESAAGPGVADVRGEFPKVFASLVRPWTSRYGSVPAVLCGMVGSDIGWTLAPYVECPVSPAGMPDRCVAREDGRVHIVPGLRCRNRLGSPDFMRGEETQILGAIRLDPSLAVGRHLVCLPGTHTKWALLDNGSVAEFLTAPTGELFSVLREHSVLVRDNTRSDDIAADVAFEQGVRRVQAHPQAALLHLLFECRSRRLAGELAPQSAAAFVSGLLVGSDVCGALSLFGRLREVAGGAPAPSSGEGSEVTLVGASALTRLYAVALSLESIPSRSVEGSAASLAGLSAVHAHLAGPGRRDAA